MEIKQLKLYSRNLKEQFRFYQEILGLECMVKSEYSISFQIGTSQLTFVEDINATPYHFAINIPSNQENEAYKWLKERVVILKDGVHQIQDFDFWNAKAIYFYDADQNIVELIARKNMNINSNKEFSMDSLIAISEIGVPTDDIEKFYGQLNNLVSIDIFDGGFERFCAIGNEQGLFIAINKNVKDWFPVNDKAHSSPFEISLVEKGKAFELAFNNGNMVKAEQ